MANATIGTIEYRENGVIAVPITFAENVIAPSKSVFRVERVSGDELTGVEYVLLGSGTAFALQFTIPADRKGSFKIAALGDVFKSTTGTWNTVAMTPATLTVSYSTIKPRIVNWDIPANYDRGVPVDIRIAYNVPVTGWNLNNIQNEIFILEGANLGSDLPYKWTGDSPPNFNDPVPADLTDTDWELLDAPPPGASTEARGFDANGQWHGEEAQYFLIRFPDPQEVGIFNLTPRDGGVLGPIS